jgi:O-acetyl-ADP-ribose deacetylase (regulator of RNase III)
MEKIKYIHGDATNPLENGRKILIHCCNDIGKWGKGFVVALARKWPKTRTEYINWYKSKKGFKLGAVQFVRVEPDIVVGNMIGQHGIYPQNRKPPIRYSAIEKCLDKVGVAAQSNKAHVIAPKFGAGLAGGKWDFIEQLIIKYVCSRDIPVTIYTI